MDATATAPVREAPAVTRFRAQMADRSMEPGIKKGDWMVFERSNSILNGRRALIRVGGKLGCLHVRRIRVVSGGWLAEPERSHQAYNAGRPLDSRLHQLEVLGILDHIEVLDVAIC